MERLIDSTNIIQDRNFIAYKLVDNDFRFYFIDENYRQTYITLKNAKYLCVENVRIRQEFKEIIKNQLFILDKIKNQDPIRDFIKTELNSFLLFLQNEAYFILLEMERKR